MTAEPLKFKEFLPPVIRIGQDILKDKQLPNLDLAPGTPDVRSVSASSASTELAHPLLKAEIFPKDTLNQLYHHPVIAGALQQRYSSVPAEPFHMLDSEADVERAMALYLTHEINFMFHNILPNFPRISEKRFTCQSQKTGDAVEEGKSDSRFDMVWSLDDCVVCVLEVKRWGVLHYEELREAYGVPRRPNLPPIKENQVYRFDTNGDLTVIHSPQGGQKRRNLLSKQANKYARQCPVVLLFDYRRMLLLDYRPGGPLNPADLGDQLSRYKDTEFDRAKKLPAMAGNNYDSDNPPWLIFGDPTDKSRDGYLWDSTHHKMLFGAILWGIYKQGGFDL